MSGDFFRTKDDGHARIKYLDDGTEVTLGNNSNMVFNAVDNGKLMNLGKGFMTVAAPDQPDERPMIIITHSSEVTILKGGTFTFSFIGLDATIEVQTGKVRFRRFTDGRIVEVGAGQSHTFKPAGPEKIEFEI
jgi:ferric-dicitrate binding protein FerR (iron transport regulator)